MAKVQRDPGREERYTYDPYGRFDIYEGDDWSNPLAESNVSVR